ncbi:MAG TPA: hypothetical protein PLF40_07930 [Kofleriaceae bacterium]|nr:hypothetical protein [Kofleriaceae bacterium]
MTVIQELLDTRFGPVQAIQPVVADRFVRYTNLLPANLVTHWQTVGALIDTVLIPAAK